MKTTCLILTLMLAAGAEREFRSDFRVDKANLGTAGKNEYFILEPGYRLHFAHGATKVTMTVLAETKLIDGVETRVVEDREEKNGKPAESTRDYYAVDRTTGDIYYFGEDVDNYKNGKVTGHEGSWRSGDNGAQFGLMLPARPVAGDRYFQERAPKQHAMDRSEVIATGVRVVTPAGAFDNCVHIKDTSAVERGGDHKWYAPGIGLVKDGNLVLVRIEKGVR